MPEMNIQRPAPADDGERLALIRKDLETAREALMRVMRVADAMEPITALLGETPQRLHLRAGSAVLLVDDCSQAARDLAHARQRERDRARREDEWERAS